MLPLSRSQDMPGMFAGYAPIVYDPLARHHDSGDADRRCLRVLYRCPVFDSRRIENDQDVRSMGTAHCQQCGQ